MKHAHFSKGIAAFTLSLALLTGLCACGGRNSSTPDNASASTDISSAVSSDTSNETTTSSETPTSSTTATSEASSVKPSSSKAAAASSVKASPSKTATASGKAASSMPTSASEAYKAVLNGQMQFYSTDNNAKLNISQLARTFAADNSTKVSVTQFAVIDLDKDGTPEVVLCESDYLGYEILKYQGGVVYGYNLPYRAFNQLKTDGTFSFSSGAADSGFGSITFTTKAYSINEITYSQSSTDSDGSMNIAYFVNKKSATEDEFNAAVTKEQNKSDVIWQNFTKSNVSAKLS